MKAVNGHSHGASSENVEVAKIKTSVKPKAEETDCIANSSQAALGSITNFRRHEKNCTKKTKSIIFCSSKSS